MAKIRVRARTVDMLGRQQIAGIPTAISELFKNAHDAYAKKVEVDYYHFDGLFVLRDNGVGMSRFDFEQRWLTLGTESKLGEGGIDLPPQDASQAKRAILGEKGIGRLAIAAIGDQVLILTRPKTEDCTGTLTAAFLHWGIFALPGIDLDQIEIPVEEFDVGEFPDRAQIQKMTGQFTKCLKKIARSDHADAVSAITKAVSTFDVDPGVCAAFLPSDPELDLRNQGSGTHFYIKPADATLKDDIGDPDDEDTASPLMKMLLGFSNTMTPKHDPPKIVAKFRNHLEDGVCNELIGDSAFFTPAEFDSADHHVQGTFDAFGQFRGTVRVYDKEAVEYVCPWTNPTGGKTTCGKFGIEFACVQGIARESHVPRDDHGRLTSKLNRIGGLYIYRDGIRVLPYGDSDYDFLDIERRRTKSAGYYFFSYRRIFGVVRISREANPTLVEKAGREGFRQNRAYREFRKILEHFFIQLAADFFREGGVHADVWDTTRTELEQQELLRRKREQESKSRRAEFQSRLQSVFAEIEAEIPESKVEGILNEFKNGCKALGTPKDKSQSPLVAMRLREEAKQQLTQLREHLRITKPRGWGLTKSLQRDWAAYQTEFLRLESDVFDAANQNIDDTVQELGSSLGTSVDDRIAIRNSLETLRESSVRQIRSLESQVRDGLGDLSGRVLDQTRSCITTLRSAIDEVLVDFESISDAKELHRRHSRWEKRIAAIVDQQSLNLTSLSEQLKTAGTSEGSELTDVTGAMEEELIDLRERESVNLELVQVGMALGVIHHEFRGCVKSLRKSLQSLKRWADTNAALGELYSSIRTNFEHLDGYLTLFTPLTRRLQRSKTQITGKSIFIFLEDLFRERLQRNGVTMDATQGFLDSSIYEYPSSIYPCFVNLIDNAIFWVSDVRGPRQVKLDFVNGEHIIEDTGPGIKARDATNVFEMGFTRKPSGQGMGLYVCRQTLKGIGYELLLDPPAKGKGARFRMRPLPPKS